MHQGARKPVDGFSRCETIIRIPAFDFGKAAEPIIRKAMEFREGLPILRAENSSLGNEFEKLGFDVGDLLIREGSAGPALGFLDRCGFRCHINLKHNPAFWIENHGVHFRHSIC